MRRLRGLEGRVKDSDRSRFDAWLGAFLERPAVTLRDGRSSAIREHRVEVIE